MIFGWDLGGAHVKLAVLDAHGQLDRVEQVPCELWKGLERLESALHELTCEPVHGAVHAITMTGELVDLFPDRASGVAAIVEAFLRVVPARDTTVFAGSRFVSAREAAPHWREVASANWRATAELVAQLLPQALILDIGSTTADLVLVSDGKVRAQAVDDHGRLAREELLYTGVVRTPLMAVAARVPFDGEWVSVIAEHFATAADVYRLTGELDPAFDQAATADGRGRSKLESRRRLARMIGLDLEQAPEHAWDRLATWLARAQQQRVRLACDRHLSRGLLDVQAPLVGLGVGAFLAVRVAKELGRPYVDFATLAGAGAEQAAAVDVCGPAFAVASLRAMASEAPPR